ncbi:nectin-3 isoform X3 [Rhinolophus sinicus]|uniref:nectin-3 isoform X3 n=1 Tax=Rhinolophus sinicus TaxID=89399 RepID=UPI003D7AB367
MKIKLHVLTCKWNKTKEKHHRIRSAPIGEIQRLLLPVARRGQRTAQQPGEAKVGKQTFWSPSPLPATLTLPPSRPPSERNKKTPVQMCLRVLGESGAGKKGGIRRAQSTQEAGRRKSPLSAPCVPARRQMATSPVGCVQLPRQESLARATEGPHHPAFLPHTLPGSRSPPKGEHCSGALAGPIIVEPHVTAVWGKNVSLKCLIEVNETITQISWEKIHGKSSQTVAVHHPQYGFSVQGEYQGRVLFKNYSLNDATITLHNIGFSDSGKYICKAVTFPLGNAQSSTTVTVLVEPTVSLIKGPDSLIDGGNETVAAICIAATGKPVAHINWEGDLGEMESTTTTFPNETTTIVSQYKLFPTRFARGRRITCVVKHPALEKDIRYSFILDIQYAPEVSVTGYDGNWFVGRKGVNLKCNADANPPPFKSVWSRLDGQWPDGLLASDNTLHFVHPLTFNYSGVYVCKVTNSLGQRSDQKVIYISDVPFKQTSSIAIAGAVIGAVLALLIIAVFVTVLLTPRKKRPSYLDKVIDLPPTHKPPPMYDERSPPLPQKDLLFQLQGALPSIPCGSRGVELATLWLRAHWPMWESNRQPSELGAWSSDRLSHRAGPYPVIS